LANYEHWKNPLLPARWLISDKLTPVDLHWYGNSASDSMRVNFDAAKQLELSLDGRIHYHSAPVDSAEAYKTADFVFLPSLFEGCPNVICEAMACGLPVLCSRVSDNPEIVKEGVNGFLFDPKEPQAFGAAVKKLLQLSPEERHVMGVRNAIKARECFSPIAFAESWNALLARA
jgi:glycosyltransferase involved in cell wall biosynthesis